MAEPVTARAARASALTARLAFADYRHEWVMSACAVLALAAVLVPLLVLFGLKYGLISTLLDPLVENPRYREITPLASGRYDEAWFDTMRARDDVAFVAPRTRSLAATIRLRAPDSAVGRIIDVELVPSMPGDPVLPGDMVPPAGFSAAVIVSHTAAEKLGVDAGGRVEGIISRTRGGTQETVRLPLAVGDIAPHGAFARDALFVSPALIGAVEDFLDGRAVPALDWDGGPARVGPRSYASFRMYARGIDDVEGLRAHLAESRIDVRTSLADISLVRTLERNLGVAYWIIAVIAIAGFFISFATNVWANVDRKRREFSVLRLTGFRTGQIVWFPILQAALTAVLAWLLASLVYFGVESLLNALFAASVGGGAEVCRLRASHLFAALAITVFAAAAAAAVGGRRVAGLEPSIGLRER